MTIDEMRFIFGIEDVNNGRNYLYNRLTKE